MKKIIKNFDFFIYILFNPELIAEEPKETSSPLNKLKK
ncbi:MAG: hypothetical protein PWP28_92 [Oceanotoga sp.]|jgi:hypothetical protein|uniref:Uncharacterized protein n=1 Tax=Oceanotoga teriensis TaxID=515440 RepID=A0AA45HJL0_9BACT|nr:hypothetical protein [Oceanotoga sp.]PWJ95977.1 hypothetical protein C7380_103157 [Oceanotoga teriensis]